MRDPITEPPSMKVYICTIRANPLDTYGTDTIAEIHTDYENAMKWLDYHSAESDQLSKVERRGYETTVFKEVDGFKYVYVTYRVHIKDIYGVIPYEPDSQAYSAALHEAHTIATEEEQEREQLDTSYQGEGKHGDDSPSVSKELADRTELLWEAVVYFIDGISKRIVLSLDVDRASSPLRGDDDE